MVGMSVEIITPGGGKIVYGHHLLKIVGRLGTSSSAPWPTGTDSGDAIEAAGRYRLGGLDVGGVGLSRKRGKGEVPGVDEGDLSLPGIEILGSWFACGTVRGECDSIPLSGISRLSWRGRVPAEGGARKSLDSVPETAVLIEGRCCEAEAAVGDGGRS